MKLQFVTVREAGASVLLPLHPETVRVFMILKEARADGKPRPPPGSFPLPAPSAAVRPSRARARPSVG